MNNLFNTITILFLLMVNFAFGQKDNPYDFYDWVGKDFIENEINSTSTYIYKLDDNGNIKDSVLFYIKQFDISENKIFGTKYNTVFEIFHTNFEIYYNDIGQIIKDKRIRISVEDADTSTSCDEIDYEYDSLNREIKKTDKSTYINYCKKRKTHYSQHIIIDEYVYNSNNQKIEKYWTNSVTETTYLKRNKTKTIDYFVPKCLFAKWKYDSLSNLTEQIYFTLDSLSLIRGIITYFYDDQNRLIQQNDSTKWNIVGGYYTTDFFCSRTYTYEYTDTGRIETHIEYYQKDTIRSKSTSYYNNDNKIVKMCSIVYFGGFGNSCIEYFYFYENDKLTKTIASIISENSGEIIHNVRETLYYYNEKGLLREMQGLMNDKLTWHRRYYYE